MLRREHHVSRSKKGIGPRREYLDFLAEIRDAKLHQGAFAATYPIALKQFDPFGPVKPLEFIDEPLRVGGDAKHPLPHRTPLDGVPTNLTLAVDDLLVGKHRAEGRTPVYGHFSHIGEPDAIRVVAFVGFDGFRLAGPGIEP